MNLDEAKQAYDSMPRDSQARFLALLGHDLTIAARGTYVAGSDEVADSELLRKFNEIQHRVFDCVQALLSNGDDAILGYWDSVIVETVFVEGESKLAQGARWAFAEALRKMQKN